MAKLSWSMRILPLALFLVAVSAVGQTTVTVGPDACTLSQPNLTVAPGDQIKWATNPSTATLGIIFYKSGYPAGVSEDPLTNMTHNPTGGYNTVATPKSTQTVNPNVFNNSTATQLSFKYWQVLNGTPCDGRIIIIRPVKK